MNGERKLLSLRVSYAYAPGMMNPSLRTIPLDALPFFDATMRQMSFSGAAQELNVSASAVSQRIKSLEQILGVSLFERLPHGLQPTEAGRLYLLEVRPALRRLHAASSRLATRGARRPAGRERRLSIDVLPALASMRMAPRLRSFAERFPDVELRMSSSPALSDPERDGFDCCIRYGAGGWTGVDAQFLADEHALPVCAPGLLRELGPVESPTALARFPLIHDLMPVGWAEWFASVGVSDPPTGGLMFTDSAIALSAAADGLGVVVGRSRLIAADLASGRLVPAWHKELPSPFHYWLVRPRSRPDALVDLFVEWLIDEIFE